MSAYQIRTEDDREGVRHWRVWWNPGRLDRDGYHVEELEGSPFDDAHEASEAVAADRHRRAGEPE